jgi:hypothetical protein
MNDDTLHENAIASRELEFRFTTGGSERVLVSIYSPRPAEEPEMWWCPYSIIGNKVHKIFRMAGIDAIQALTLTLATIPVELEWLSRKHEGEFLFLGEHGHCFSEIPSQQ